MGEVQVLDGNGRFKEEALEALLAEHGVCRGDPAFNVVAILGPQSSGKSTVLNEAFGTSFETMDAKKGRCVGYACEGFFLCTCVRAACWHVYAGTFPLGATEN